MPGTAIMVSGIAALAGLGGAITLFFVKRARYAQWKRTSGTVFELVRCSKTEHPYRESWETQIEFQTGQGRRIRFSAATLSKRLTTSPLDVEPQSRKTQQAKNVSRRFGDRPINKKGLQTLGSKKWIYSKDCWRWT